MIKYRVERSQQNFTCHFPYTPVQIITQPTCAVCCTQPLQSLAAKTTCIINPVQSNGGEIIAHRRETVTPTGVHLPAIVVCIIFLFFRDEPISLARPGRGAAPDPQPASLYR